MIALWFALSARADAPAPPAVEAPKETLLTGTFVIAVPKPEDTADVLVERAMALGGWFRSRSPGAVSLAVPAERFDELVKEATSQGLVLSRQLQHDDVSRQLAELRGRLAAREEVLHRYEAVLGTASHSAVLTVSQQLSDAIGEVESLRGQITLLEDQAKYGRIDVSFQFRERAAPVPDGSSSFPWLNTLNLTDLLADAVAAEAPAASRGVRPVAPDGFAGFHERRRYRALSPDGVLYRVRTMKLVPRADVDFWEEAVHDRMERAGYTRIDEGDVRVAGLPGAFTLQAAPVGAEDWLYWVAFVPNGRRILIVEAGGPVERLQQRKEAIVAAAGAISP